MFIEFNLNMKKVITHSGGFHTDDVFAVATLQLHFGIENVEVVRTRDEEVINTGDIVVDVGGVFDPARHRFDHHQNGAPVRENNIPYAAFGLVWKQYGEKVAGTKEVADAIERQLVLPIDANDNGVSLFTLNEIGASPILMQDIISSFKPAWGTDGDMDQSFLLACEFARGVIERARSHATADYTQSNFASELYKNAVDKKILIADRSVAAAFFTDYPEVMFVVCPDDSLGCENWTATAIRSDHNSFATKVRFPESWAGLRDEELGEVSGIPDAVFCHKARFLFVAGSKEGVLKAVEEVLG